MQKEQDFGQYMYFETLTLFPIDTRLMDLSLLEAKEITWINQYHARVYAELTPKITDNKVLEWLKIRTQAI